MALEYEDGGNVFTVIVVVLVLVLFTTLLSWAFIDIRQTGNPYMLGLCVACVGWLTFLFAPGRMDVKLEKLQGGTKKRRRRKVLFTIAGLITLIGLALMIRGFIMMETAPI